jgi:hypothetical protein
MDRERPSSRRGLEAGVVGRSESIMMVSLHNRDLEIGLEPEEDGPCHDQTLWEQAWWRIGSITVAEDPRDAWRGTAGRHETSRRSGPATNQD